MGQLLEKIWYQDHFLKYPLMPVSAIYWLVSGVRGRFQRWRWRGNKTPVPVIVVGNISVGGTGKSPVVAALVEFLEQKGFRPGIVSRGYGGASAQYPLHVNEDTLPAFCGDEPLMLKQQTKVPVVVAPDRMQAVRALLDTYDCNVIVSDDGLQHYRMPRFMEIVVVDGQRGFGNGYCLPAGPLRELPRRIGRADYLLVNGGTTGLKGLEDGLSFYLEPTGWSRVSGDVDISLEEGIRRFGQQVNAVAGIGNPSRFFDTLRVMGFSVSTRAFPDHHVYSTGDLSFGNNHPVLMTEKDAIKCQELDSGNLWYLKVSAKLDEELLNQIAEKIRLYH